MQLLQGAPPSQYLKGLWGPSSGPSSTAAQPTWMTRLPQVAPLSPHTHAFIANSSSSGRGGGTRVWAAPGGGCSTGSRGCTTRGLLGPTHTARGVHTSTAPSRFVAAHAPRMDREPLKKQEVEDVWMTEVHGHVVKV